MADQRMTHCAKCGKEYISGELDPDDFDADLEELGWIVPDEGMRFEGGIYRCPECQLNVRSEGTFADDQKTLRGLEKLRKSEK